MLSCHSKSFRLPRDWNWFFLRISIRRIEESVRSNRCLAFFITNSQWRGQFYSRCLCRPCFRLKDIFFPRGRNEQLIHLQSKLNRKNELNRHICLFETLNAAVMKQISRDLLRSKPRSTSNLESIWVLITSTSKRITNQIRIISFRSDRPIANNANT